jgi:hypothetical protein
MTIFVALPGPEDLPRMPQLMDNGGLLNGDSAFILAPEVAPIDSMKQLYGGARLLDLQRWTSYSAVLLYCLFGTRKMTWD